MVITTPANSPSSTPNFSTALNVRWIRVTVMTEAGGVLAPALKYTPERPTGP